MISVLETQVFQHRIVYVEAIIDLVNNEEPTVLHGYMSNAGFEDVRETIAQSLNRRFGHSFFCTNNLIMTVGAASGLNVALRRS